MSNIAKEILKIASKAVIDKNFLPLQAGDVPATYADVTDLVNDLGYKTQTPVQEGINKFVDWYLEFFQIDN
jgi:UDP-glucuronate 4-epimerase